MSRRRPQQLSMNFRGFTSMFDAARGDQFNLDWTTFPISINQAVWQSLPQMRARSRDMGRNSPYYTRYIESTKQNVAGARGVRFQNRAKGPDNQLLTELNAASTRLIVVFASATVLTVAVFNAALPSASVVPVKPILPSTTSRDDISMFGGTGIRPPSYTTPPVAASRQVMIPLSLVT